jgi:carbamoyl-phosphate synthase large subunit
MNIFLTSAGRRGYLVDFFKQALGDEGTVHVGNSSPISSAFVNADKTVVTPLIYDEGYIPFLKEYCIKNDIKVLISLFDIDLYALSLYKQEFEELGVKVIVSNTEVISVCNDKWETYRFCLDNKISAPKTYIDLEEAIADIKSGVLKLPVIVKPRWGMGSLSIYEADDIDELKVFYRKTQKGIISSYLKYEAQQDFERSVLIQEKLSGCEYGLDIINNLDGEYINTIIRKKYAMRSGETDCAKIVEDDKVLDLAKRISNQLKHVGNLDVDVFLVDEKPYLLEMNARFGGGYPFSHIAGVDLPKAILLWGQNKIAPIDLFKPKVGLIGHKDIKIVDITNQIEK